MSKIENIAASSILTPHNILGWVIKNEENQLHQSVFIGFSWNNELKVFVYVCVYIYVVEALYVIDKS